MKPFINLAQTTTPDGATLALHEHDGAFYLKLNGRQLMSSIATVSEKRLADLACEGLPPAPRVLIGGLGLGFSLKRVLDLVGPDAQVFIAELVPEVVDWHRQFLTGLTGPILDDPRVTIVGDVYKAIAKGEKGFFDSILLDVDNSPDSLVHGKNARLYDREGLSKIARVLSPSPVGRVAFWSALDDPAFVKRLGFAGFSTESVPCKSHESAKREAHFIFMGYRLSDELVAAAKPAATSTPPRNPAHKRKPRR